MENNIFFTFNKSNEILHFSKSGFGFACSVLRSFSNWLTFPNEAILSDDFNSLNERFKETGDFCNSRLGCNYVDSKLHYIITKCRSNEVSHTQIRSK